MATTVCAYRMCSSDVNVEIESVGRFGWTTSDGDECEAEKSEENKKSRKAKQLINQRHTQPIVIDNQIIHHVYTLLLHFLCLVDGSMAGSRGLPFWFVKRKRMQSATVQCSAVQSGVE